MPEHTSFLLHCPACADFLGAPDSQNDCITNDDFWECECPGMDSIKLKELQPVCPNCRNTHEECADAREYVLQHFGYV